MPSFWGSHPFLWCMSYPTSKGRRKTDKDNVTKAMCKYALSRAKALSVWKDSVPFFYAIRLGALFTCFWSADVQYTPAYVNAAGQTKPLATRTKKKQRLPDSYHQVHLVPSLPFGSSCKVQSVLAVFFIRRTLVNVEVEKQDETKRGTGHPCENLERKRLQCRYGSPSNLDVALTSRELNMSLAIHFLFLHFVPTTHYLHM